MAKKSAPEQSVDYLDWRGKAEKVTCIDCATQAEYYIIYPQIWAETGLGPRDGNLCLSCLTQRLGRQLHLDDFTMAPVNHKKTVLPAILKAVTERSLTVEAIPPSDAKNLIDGAEPWNKTPL